MRDRQTHWHPTQHHQRVAQRSRSPLRRRPDTRRQLPSLRKSQAPVCWRGHLPVRLSAWPLPRRRLSAEAPPRCLPAPYLPGLRVPDDRSRVRGAAMSLVMPASQASCRPHPRWNMLNLVSYSTHWPHLFPQHGPGRKHEREIALAPWQQLIVDRFPGRLLRGLIHSDGCRVENRIRHPKKTTFIRGTSSPTARSTSRESFARPATGSGSRGARTAPGTSRSPGETRSRSSTAT